MINTSFRARVAALAVLCLAALVCDTASARVLLGVDNLLLHKRWMIAGKKIAVVTNHTGITGDGRRTIDALRTAPGTQLVTIFTPEHGLTGTVNAGNSVASSVDSATGVPVISLYGAFRAPKKEMLKGLDAIVYDIQDIGIRSYTFISTLGLVMRSAATAGVKVIVLDRPGLIANRVDGNVLDTAYRSFVGMYPIPYVYGMTVGELASLINDEAMVGAKCALTVVPMEGWTRTMPWDSTGLVWKPTSPNIPLPTTALYCAAFGAIGELGAGYQGIGTPDAFRVFGGWKFPVRSLDSALRAHHLAGVHTSFGDTTIITKAGTSMPVAYLKFRLDKDSVADLFALGLHVIAILHRMHILKPADSSHQAMFRKVCGANILDRIFMGESVEQITQGWAPARTAFMEKRAKHLLYR